MAANRALVRSRRYWCRIALLLLVTIPLLPEIVIWVAAGVAALKGCHPDQKDACLVGSLPVADIIAFALQAGAGLVVAGIRASHVWLIVFYAAITGWLVLCYIALTLGWSSTLTRLVLGFTVALVFAFMPYFGPMLAIANLANANCRPNDGGVGACSMYGGLVGSLDHSPAHDAITLGWLAPYGALLTLMTFAFYAVLVVVADVVARKQRKPGQPITTIDLD